MSLQQKLVPSIAWWFWALLNVLNLTLGDVDLLGFVANLLVMADLLGCVHVHALPVMNIGTLSVINIVNQR